MGIAWWSSNSNNRDNIRISPYFKIHITNQIINRHINYIFNNITELCKYIFTIPSSVMFKVILRFNHKYLLDWSISGVVQYIKIFQKYVNHRMRIPNCCIDKQSGYAQKSHNSHHGLVHYYYYFLLDVIFGGLWLYTIIYKYHWQIMNRNLIYFPTLIALVFTLSLTTIESFNSVIGQVDPSQDPIQPIPPSNTTNTNQTTPIVFSQYPAL